MITNPVLKGFNPDPSIVRVGDDFYIATSTFEWFPGVQIHHSRDLVHWHLIGHPLDRISQINMVGDVDSGGVWAPCLSWHDGNFYLIYSDMKQWRGAFKMCHNFLVTSPDISGPWSDPVFLNGSGFDPSLFHDDDGRAWLVNQIWDHRVRVRRNGFAGIVLQEYDRTSRRLTGPVSRIFQGTPIGLTEGPHLYKRDGYYYLMTAEGGTSYGHAVTMARSRTLTGPYEVDPENPILTSSADPNLELQKAGHASLVDTPDGKWYLAHLCSRPIGPERRSTLGRETAIQEVTWTDDGWIRLADGGRSPRVTVPAPELPAHPFQARASRDEFEQPELPADYQSLRVPAESSWMSLTDRPGYLRLYGRQALSSRHEQSIVARRAEAFRFQASTRLEFAPSSFLQMAGLTAFYDAGHHYYLHVTHHEEIGRCLNLYLCNHDSLEWVLDEPIPVGDAGATTLRVSVDYETVQFAYSAEDTNWVAIGPTLDATLLSDENANGFTGMFVGMCAQDINGDRATADFDWFEYREL